MPALDSISPDLLRNGARAMSICNACRYCEGFCAVFPAMERRLSFTPGDLVYLANLCHDCRACYYSCQYAPPHEFDLNLPRVLAELRRETYRAFAWPAPLVRLFGRTGPSLAATLLVSPAIFLLGALLVRGAAAVFSAHSVEEGSFYRIVPHEVMVVAFGAAGSFALVAMGAAFHGFRRETGWSTIDSRVIRRALGDASSLRYLGGAGDGCADSDERASTARRWFHHLTFYGFALSFASTTVAAIYHNLLGWRAPYELASVPVVLGTVGGLGLLAGPLGLLLLKAKRDPAPADPIQTRMDVALLALLFLTSLTGLSLLVLRETAAMGVVLALHLGLVMGLFLVMPYGKFVHGIYRFAALLRCAGEGRGR